MLTLRIGRRDRSRPGPARRPPRAPAVGRRRGGAHGGRAVDDPRPHREDRRARPRRRGADVSRDPGRERAPPGRAAAQHSARGCPRAGPRSRGGRVQGPQPGRRMSEVLELTAAQAGERVRAGEVSASELFELYRERARGDELGAFLWVSDAAPAEPPREAPLGGVPLGVKDLYCVKGVPSAAASRILEGYRPPYTATAVERLNAAGAPTLGKTNMDEFAMGSSNENSGFGPVRNPWDTERVPGGSSGGSAAAVAAGLAPWAVGTDTGGPIRQPAALGRIVGLQPTYGAVSRYGMIAFASSLDQCGPLTRDVADSALLFRHMVGRDKCDSTSLDYLGRVELPSAESLEGVRFGIWGLEEEGVEPGVAEACRQALAKIEELGGAVEEIELPHASYGLSAYYVLAPAEASANLARYDGVRYGQRVEAGDLTEMYEETRAQGFGAEVKRRIMLGTYPLASGYYEAYSGRAHTAGPT